MCGGDQRRLAMGGNPAGDKADFGQFQFFEQIQRWAQMAVMNRVESAAENANGMGEHENERALKLSRFIHFIKPGVAPNKLNSGP